MPRALVTNDDGIDSPGLHALATAALQAGLEVIVAAPAEQASGASAALTAVRHEGRTVVARREIPGLDGVEAWSVEAWRAGSTEVVQTDAVPRFAPDPAVAALVGRTEHAHVVGRDEPAARGERRLPPHAAPRHDALQRRVPRKPLHRCAQFAHPGCHLPARLRHRGRHALGEGGRERRHRAHRAGGRATDTPRSRFGS